MEYSIKVAGIILILLSIIHVVFPSYFKWKEELKRLSLINRQLMIIHTFFIALIVLLMGVLCLTSSYELIHTNLGKSVSLGMGIFWTARLIIQFIGYSSELWRGKTFETIVHVVFTIVWVFLSALFMYNGLVN